MPDPYLSEIRLFAGGVVPKGWAACDGAVLPIAQNQALFSLLGTSYGGDGRATFALPDLRGAVALHGGGSPPVGTRGGAASVTLTIDQIPGHAHPVVASSNPANSPRPASAYCAATTQSAYAAGGSKAMSPSAVAAQGGQQPHDNMAPYLALQYCIALSGVYPSRS